MSHKRISTHGGATQMRITLVVAEYLTVGGGRGGIHGVAEFVRRVFEAGAWDVKVVSPRMARQAAESRQFLALRTWLSPIRTTVRPDGVTNVGAHLAEWEVARYLPRRAMDRELERTDVILVIAGSPAAAYITRRTRLPVILQVATLAAAERQAADRGRPKGVRAWARRANTMIVSRLDVAALKNVDAVMVENFWMRDRCEALGASNVILCPPGTDTDTFSPGSQFNPDGDIVMVARLGDSRKDFVGLLKAYSLARRAGVTQNLTLVGHGKLPSETLDHIQSLGLRDHVVVRSGVESDELIRLLQDASLFVMSSFEEGLGIAMVEAMACGLPVLSTATEGGKFVLNRQTLGRAAVGELVPINDPSSLAAAMTAWLSDPEALAEAARSARLRAIETFSIQATASVFEGVARTLAGENT